MLTFSVTDPEIPGHAVIHSATGPGPKISSTHAGAFTGAAYPILNLCKSGHYRPLSSLMVREDPAVYPFFDLYPSVEKYSPPTVPTEMSLNGNYLLMIMIPTFISFLTDASSFETSTWRYPNFNLCK